MTIGACATSGGIQALRNFADVDEFLSAVYASPGVRVDAGRSTPISDHVHVDFELQGCPINKRQLLEVISAFLNERRPGDLLQQRLHGVQAARQRVRDGRPRHPLPGPVTHAGCGALCPSYDRGCYGCYGPMETPNTASLSGWLRGLGAEDPDLVRVYRTFNANAAPFREESEAHER